MQQHTLWREITLNLLAFWVLGYLGLFVCGAILPGASGALDVAIALVWPWIIGIVILGWLYLVRR